MLPTRALSFVGALSPTQLAPLVHSVPVLSQVAPVAVCACDDDMPPPSTMTAEATAVEKNVLLVRRKARRVQEWEEGSWGVILLAVMEDDLTSNNYCGSASGFLPSA